MILGRVVGQAVATVKRPQFEGAKLLLVQPETPEGTPVGATNAGRAPCIAAMEESVSPRFTT